MRSLRIRLITKLVKTMAMGNASIRGNRLYYANLPRVMGINQVQRLSDNYYIPRWQRVQDLNMSIKGVAEYTN